MSHPLYEENTDIRRLAARYVEAARSVQPTGPYLLGGWSMGGVVAFEMAQQLRRAGQEVPALYMFDCWRPPPALSISDEDIVLSSLATLLRDREVPLTDEDLRKLLPSMRPEDIVKTLDLADLIPPGVEMSHARQRWQLFVTNLKASLRYEPEVYPGRVIFYRTEERMAMTPDDPTMGWDKLSGSIEVHLVPGTHNTMMQKPNVDALGALLRTHLDAALNAILSSRG